MPPERYRHQLSAKAKHAQGDDISKTSNENRYPAES
jgi:hypothetical protein